MRMMDFHKYDFLGDGLKLSFYDEDFIMKSFYIHEILLSLQFCPGGEIGRRTVFRSQRGKPCAGSNPVLGTMPFSAKLRGHFYLRAGKLACLSQKIKMTETAEGGKGHCSPSQKEV